MKIAVLSDTHGRLATVARALELIHSRQVARILHCGDIDDVETVRVFNGLSADFVLGNCDANPGELRQAIEHAGGVLHEPYGHLELAGRQIAWIHGHDRRLFQDLAHSDAFDYLFYGHSHIAEEHRTGRTRVINPGALHRARTKTFVVVDLSTENIESVAIG